MVDLTIRLHTHSRSELIHLPAQIGQQHVRAGPLVEMVVVVLAAGHATAGERAGQLLNVVELPLDTGKLAIELPAVAPQSARHPGQAQDERSFGRDGGGHAPLPWPGQLKRRGPHQQSGASREADHAGHKQ